MAGLGFQQFMFNVANGKRAEDNPFKNKLVRQAFQYAIDRNAINEVAGGGIFEPAQQPFPPASQRQRRPSATWRPRAAQAGFERVKAEVMFGNTTTSSVAEMVQAMASEAGFDLSLRPTEYAALQRNRPAAIWW